jgi:hypothetical protein
MPGEGVSSKRPVTVPSEPGLAALPMRWLKAFGRFWWDFLVGDTPELFVATVLILGITAVLAKAVSTTAAWVAMPIMVTGALAASVWRGRR